MANRVHLKTLRQGADAWNAWRKEKDPFLTLIPDLSGANLNGADLSGVNLRNADLRRTNLMRADLSEANLICANLSEANLTGALLGGGADFSGATLVRADLSAANLMRANFARADLTAANLSEANLIAANLAEANLTGANLSRAKFTDAKLSGVNLSEANLTGANFFEANLSKANLSRANLNGASLDGASLVKADITGADLTGCHIYGVSAWGLKLSKETKQQNLIIKEAWGEPEVIVDSIEVAQFVYLLLNNEKIRHVIDTITSKAVLILGRFTAERKAVLDALRDELRKRDYLPILFDFDKPASKDLTGTVTTLANMVRFIIADGTDPKSIPHELATIVPTTIVPVKPILLASEREYAMFGDLQRRYHWVLPTHRYERQEQLIADLDLCVIRPAAEKAEDLRKTVSA